MQKCLDLNNGKYSGRKLSGKQGNNKPKHKERKMKCSLGNGENVEFSSILERFFNILYQNF